MLEDLKPADFRILIAAAVMAVGAFCPGMNVPIVGSVSYVAGGRGDGVYIVACSAALNIRSLQRSIRFQPSHAAALLCELCLFEHSRHG
jgi:predicted naringenin-chalcone synthase